MRTFEDIKREFKHSYVNYFGHEPICRRCKQNAIDNCYSPEGLNEISISGFCEKCFDEITKVDEDIE
jgi:hypothetical protein